jgi:hypothetical protein
METSLETVAIEHRLCLAIRTQHVYHAVPGTAGGIGLGTGAAGKPPLCNSR